MAKFEVVLWEQRRIVTEVEAKDEEDAELQARIHWSQMCDMDAAYDIPEITDIDEQDIKSAVVTERGA